jgi:hypothetical protein
MSALKFLHRKKKVREFPVPSWDVTAKLSMGGNNDVITELFLPRGSLVSDIPAGDGKLVNFFLRCIGMKTARKFSAKKANNKERKFPDLPEMPVVLQEVAEETPVGKPGLLM